MLEFRKEAVWLWLVLVLFCILVLSGCSSYGRIKPESSSEYYAYAGQVADLLTTGYAMCYADNFVESTPVLRLGGDDCASVIITSTLFKWGVFELLYHWNRHQEGKKKFWIWGTAGVVPAVINLERINDDS